MASETFDPVPFLLEWLEGMVGAEITPRIIAAARDVLGVGPPGPDITGGELCPPSTWYETEAANATVVDRSEPPPGYIVQSRHNGTHVDWYWGVDLCSTAPHLASSHSSAVANCWAHRDAVLASARPQGGGAAPEGSATWPEWLDHKAGQADTDAVKADDEDASGLGSHWWRARARAYRDIANAMRNAAPSPPVGGGPGYAHALSEALWARLDDCVADWLSRADEYGQQAPLVRASANELRALLDALPVGPYDHELDAECTCFEPADAADVDCPVHGTAKHSSREAMKRTSFAACSDVTVADAVECLAEAERRFADAAGDDFDGEGYSFPDAVETMAKWWSESKALREAEPASLPETQRDLERLLHVAWGQAKTAEYDKDTWKSLQAAVLGRRDRPVSLPEGAREEPPPLVFAQLSASLAYEDYEGDTIWVFVSCGQLGIVCRAASGAMYETADGIPTRPDVVRAVLDRAEGSNGR